MTAPSAQPNTLLVAKLDNDGTDRTAMLQLVTTGDQIQIGVTIWTVTTFFAEQGGWFTFDVLFQWDPVFSFASHASAGIAVEVLGETLMGISFDLTS